MPEEMPEGLTEEVIDGAMFLRKCSREEALAWLTGPLTSEEIAEFEKHDRFGKILACELNFNEEQKLSFIRSSRRWDAALARHLDAIRRCRIITAEDMSVTINARDDD